MKISKNGQKLIKNEEQLRLNAYRDQKGIPTIGWGHIRNVKMGDKITVEQAQRLFDDDVNEICEKPLNKFLEKQKIEVNQNQYDALCSLIFNIGFSNFLSSSICRGLINREPIENFPKYFSWWNKVKINGVLTVSDGLINRRKREASLFVSNR